MSKYYVNWWLISPDAHISVDTGPRIFPNARKSFSITRKLTSVCNPARPSQMSFRSRATVHSPAKSAPAKTQPAQSSPKAGQTSGLRTLDELSHALAIKIGSPNLKTDNTPPEEAFLAYCQRLVTVDKKTSKSRLIHFIPQEYPGAHPELLGTALYSSRNLLRLPEFPPVQSPFSQPPSRSPGHAFLAYSSLYCRMHAKRDLSYSTNLLVRSFLMATKTIPTKSFLKS